MQREVEQLLEHFASRKPPSVRFSPWAWEPAVDLYETPEEVVVLAELAGVREEEIEVIVDGNTLVIRGQRRESQVSKRTYYQMEISKGPFERGILLPVAVDANEARASYEDGILQIVLPKHLRERTQKVKIRTT
jgi:HSP20 family protein